MASTLSIGRCVAFQHGEERRLNHFLAQLWQFTLADQGTLNGVMSQCLALVGEDKKSFKIFVKILSEIIYHNDTEDSGDVFETMAMDEHIAVVKKLWDGELTEQLGSMHGLPDFTVFWSETRWVLIGNVDRNWHNLDGIQFMGKEFPLYLWIAIAMIIEVEPKYENLTRQIMDEHVSSFEDRESDSEHQQWLYLTHRNPFLGLTTLLAMRQNPREINAILNVFMWIARSAAELVQHYRISINEDDPRYENVREQEDYMVARLQLETSIPFETLNGSSHSLHICADLPGFNLRGCFEMILLFAVEVRITPGHDTGDEYLPYHCMNAVLVSAWAEEIHGNHMVREVIAAHADWGYFTRSWEDLDQFPPIPNYRWTDGERYSFLAPSDAFVEVAGDSDIDDRDVAEAMTVVPMSDLEDAELAPAGEPLKVSDYADKVSSGEDGLICSICRDDLVDGETFKPRCCTHLFHQECLDTLINGIENWSGKCPECRAVIAPPRERQLKREDRMEE